MVAGDAVTRVRNVAASGTLDVVVDTGDTWLLTSAKSADIDVQLRALESGQTDVIALAQGVATHPDMNDIIYSFTLASQNVLKMGIFFAGGDTIRIANLDAVNANVTHLAMVKVRDSA